MQPVECYKNYVQLMNISNNNTAYYSQSVARFLRSCFGKFPWPIGCYWPTRSLEPKEKAITKHSYQLAEICCTLHHTQIQCCVKYISMQNCKVCVFDLLCSFYFHGFDVYLE